MKEIKELPKRSNAMVWKRENPGGGASGGNKEMEERGDSEDDWRCFSGLKLNEWWL